MKYNALYSTASVVMQNELGLKTVLVSPKKIKPFPLNSTVFQNRAQEYLPESKKKKPSGTKQGKIENAWNPIRNYQTGQLWWFTPVILALLGGQGGRIT